MNKDLFESLQARAKDFGGRSDAGDSEVRVEIVMTTGRTFVLDQVVEAADAFIHFDGTDPGNDDAKVSVLAPYYQVGSVLLTATKTKPRGAGFTSRV